jgi:hypothetical protein
VDVGASSNRDRVVEFAAWMPLMEGSMERAARRG